MKNNLYENPCLGSFNSSQRHLEVKDDALNIDLFEELNILGKVNLNKPSEMNKTIQE